MTLLQILLIIINFAGALAVFLFAMKLMSEGLQKVAGSRMRAVLGRITNKPLSGILTGTVVTAAIQSSSATTVMVVSFVNAGLLTLSGAVAVIMGANIGTTVTAWIITLLGLGESSGYFSLPLAIAAVSLIFLFTRKDRSKSLAQTILGLSLLLVGMQLLQSAMPNLEDYPGLLQGIASLSGYGFWSILLFIAIGALLTCIVQASAAMMAITLVMCYNGWIGFDMAVALVMGQNIGTTITANIAAVVANAAGKKAARAHLVFNVVGVLITLVLFRPLMSLIARVTLGVTGCSPYADVATAGYNPESIPLAISFFHTVFNVGNTAILSWFIPQILWLVDRMVPEKKVAVGQEEYRLTYISRGPVTTAELGLQAAKREIQLFSKQVLRMYALLPELRGARSDKEFDAAMQRIADYERLTDRMEMELTDYLTSIGGGDISSHGSERIGAMLRIIDNLESIGDSIYQISLTRRNKRSDAVHFSDSQNAHIAQMSAMVENALIVMDANLADFDRADLDAAYAAERSVNTYRDQLRAEHLEALKSGRYTYAVGSAYSELFAQYEKLADYVINVSEALQPARKHTR
ncbi:MAG: phosphate:Na+ symporter [bacterium P3]|nr:MAG: phosphate:Na+ symporter [bacterium P3]KWW39006.1 MAG: phosphate:Na+ symporter [bacterium F083]